MATTDTAKQIRIVVVGDGEVGKTSMIASYAMNSFDEQHVPTVYDVYTCIVEIDGEKHSVQIHDTAGQEDYDRTRPIAYPGTNCFIMVFSIDSETSLTHIEWKWMPEIRHFSKETPILLVANKKDRRREEVPSGVVSAEMGQQMATKMKADAYAECSAKTREGIKPVFDRAIGLALRGPKIRKKKKCTFA